MSNPMLSLHNAVAKIASYNPRAEKHGEENVPAGDIKFEVNVHSSALDSFDRSYRPFLFRKADASGDQASLIPGDDLTSLAKPKLRALRLDEEFPGYTLRIGTGLDMSEPLVLTEAELSGFVIGAKQGGSVALTFSATVHPDTKQAGALCDLIQDTVELTLEPPKAEAQLVDAPETVDAEAD